MPQLLVLKEDRGSQLKGDIIEIRSCGTSFGGSEPDLFVMVEIPMIPLAAYEKYMEPWKTEISYEVVQHNLGQDSYRIKVSSATASVGGLGRITREQVENFLTSWKASIASAFPNAVTCDFAVFPALSAPAFWELEPAKVAQVAFTEEAYNQGTGIHRVRMDFSALANNPTYIEKCFANRGATILSLANKLMTFEIERTPVLDYFKRDLKQKAEKLVARRRYAVSPAVVNVIIARGGVITATESEVLGYIRDKTTL